MQIFSYIAKVLKPFLGVSVLAAVLFSLLVYAAVSYRSDPGTTVTINEWSVCKKVINSGGPSYFIPTNSSNEWSLFRSAAPGLSGLSLSECVICGGALVDSRDGKSYSTVLIGSQCWMAQHINIGTMIAGASDQTNNATIEKYCYDDTEAICTSDGGFYQWAEAMQYAASCNGTGEGSPACASPVQGICPAGWHIPSHYEYVALERAVCTSGTCATDFPYDITAGGWRGTDEGTKLKVGGSSGFNAILAGYRDDWGTFNLRGGYTNFWISLESGGLDAWRRLLGASDGTVYRDPLVKLLGVSVRCIKN